MVDRFISVSVGPAALWDAKSDTAKAGEKAMRSRRLFQLLALAALYSSIKRVHGISSSDLLTDIISYCDVYSKEEIETMERTLLKGLSWRYSTHTPYQVGYSIFSLLVPHVNLPEDAWCFLLDEIKHQTEHAVRDYYFSTQRPSTIALAAIFNAVECIAPNYQNAVGACVRRIVETYEFDQESIITMSRNRLTSNSVKKMMPPQPASLKSMVNGATKMMMPHQSIQNKSVKMMMSCLRSNVKNETIDSPHQMKKKMMASSHQSVSPDSSTKMKTPRSSSAVSPDSVKMLLLHHTSSPMNADASAMTPMSGNTTNTRVWWAPWWWKGGGGVATQMSRASPFERDTYSIWEMGKVADSKMSCHSVANNGAANKVTNPDADPNSNSNITPKPKRPLTSYHIYFQLEREYIIQTMEGEDVDKSMMHDDNNNNKVYLDYVPDRYRQIKLSPEWYFAPGKRKRRKHRKRHGKIGFLELSGMISSRWKKLSETNPEVKSFVQKIAAQERDKYLYEKEEYKKNLLLTKQQHDTIMSLSCSNGSEDDSLPSSSSPSSCPIDDCKEKVAKRSLNDVNDDDDDDDDEPSPSCLKEGKRQRLVSPRAF